VDKNLSNVFNPAKLFLIPGAVAAQKIIRGRAKKRLEKQEQRKKQLTQIKKGINQLSNPNPIVGGNLLKRLHPKKKYSKKAYQFSKSKNRTKKQLI